MIFLSAICRCAGFKFCIIAAESTGEIIRLTFDKYSHLKAVKQLQGINASAVIDERNRAFKERIRAALENYLDGQPFRLQPAAGSLFIDLGTDFQKKVWGLIRDIPYGETRTYGDLARDLGGLKYARAVGRACNANPLALFISCHRVVGVNSPGGFAGGEKLKMKLLALERAKAG